MWLGFRASPQPASALHFPVRFGYEGDELCPVRSPPSTRSTVCFLGPAGFYPFVSHVVDIFPVSLLTPSRNLYAWSISL